jgi:hypothetical protein
MALQKVENSVFRHSGKSRNPVISKCSGYRIKSGMTVQRLFASSSFLIRIPLEAV